MWNGSSRIPSTNTFLQQMQLLFALASDILHFSHWVSMELLERSVNGAVEKLEVLRFLRVYTYFVGHPVDLAQELTSMSLGYRFTSSITIFLWAQPLIKITNQRNFVTVDMQTNILTRHNTPPFGQVQGHSFVRCQARMYIYPIHQLNYKISKICGYSRLQATMLPHQWIVIHNMHLVFFKSLSHLKAKYKYGINWLRNISLYA